MPLVLSVDYPNKRIYLSSETPNTSLDTLEVYKEVRSLRRTMESHRNYKPIIEAGGNIAKLPGKYTAAFVIPDTGCYIVPYDSPSSLKLIRDTFTKDGRAGRDCFDRTAITSNIDIDVDFPEIEIREVSTGSGVGTVEEVRDAVWNTPISSLTVAGSLGEFLVKKVLTVAKFIGLK